MSRTKQPVQLLCLWPLRLTEVGTRARKRVQNACTEQYVKTTVWRLRERERHTHRIAPQNE
eukprot:3267800-Amphidinium_carterae.1